MKAYGWLGLLLLLISEYCLFRKIEPFHSWFYCFAWWSYILVADNLLLKLRGRSLLHDRKSELVRMLPLSVVIWLVFECYNVGLRNWAYNSVPAEAWLRWPGYAVAFATVLPGILITADLIEHLLFRGRKQPFASEHEVLPAPPRTRPAPAWIALGMVLAIAPVFWPRYFFATVWIGPIFLLDPLLERVGVRSLSLQIEAAGRQRAFSLLLAGFACGIMWEFWNFWAGSYWIYSVPYFGQWNIFQMPFLGFLGFPPFALECWILYHLFAGLVQRPFPSYFRIALWICMGIFCLFVFRAIDTHTVLHFVARRGL